MTHQGVEPEQLIAAFDQLRPMLIKYPRLEEDLFEQKLLRTIELWRQR